VLDAGRRELVVTYPDEILHDAIAAMLRHKIGRLPVVSRENPRRVMGYLGRTAIINARMKHLEEEAVHGHVALA
jgi:chloride channel protein, CIC family